MEVFVWKKEEEERGESVRSENVATCVRDLNNRTCSIYKNAKKKCFGV